ncbi:MAG: tryptophan--tRNA ligase [Candidatus Micrarchaeia archaeon]
MAFVVTPWKVRGEVDYEKLIREFGVSKIDEKLAERIAKHAGHMHLYLRRGLFFSHRDLDRILEEYENGKKFVLYTGRGPSGDTHIGHLVPWLFTKYLQDAFDADLYFQMTDDEKFLMREISLEDAENYSRENALDVIAIGFKEGKTKIFSDVEYIKELYRIAIQVAKRTTFSTAKAVFGFTNSSNIGIIFFPAIQAAPAFLAQMNEGRDVNCLIPCAIDQDPYWRITRDVAPLLKMPKPAAIHCKFIPGLQGTKGKMSSSEKDSAIYTTDSKEEVFRKIGNALTGGGATIKEHKEKGGKPEICVVYQWFFYLFEESDEKLRERFESCKAGELMCGECKKELSKCVWRFLEEHQRRRKEAEKKIEKFFIGKK